MAKAKVFCKLHPDKKPVMFCPACRGSSTSDRKKKSSAANGLLGGRPKKRQSVEQ